MLVRLTLQDFTPVNQRQEMGLGKTLSVLALIAWYLDSLPPRTALASATLIITTPSSESLGVL